MKKRIKTYLESKETSQYNDFDKILERYLSGELERIVSTYEEAAVYPSFNKDCKTIQLKYRYNNIYVVIDFFEDKYNVVVYHAGIDPNELQKLFIDYTYEDQFDLKTLIKRIDGNIKNHPNLKDMSLMEKKKKIYSLIAWISFCVPIVLFGSIALYVVITERSVQLNEWWMVFFLVVPFIVWLVYDLKAKRIK